MAFNLILYLLFVVFIILFQTLDSSSSTVCPGRVPDNQDNTSQQVVSLVYQGIMAGVSLLLAIVVAIFGGKLYFNLKKRDFEGKIANVTTVCCRSSTPLRVHPQSDSDSRIQLHGHRSYDHPLRAVSHLVDYLPVLSVEVLLRQAQGAHLQQGEVRKGAEVLQDRNLNHNKLQQKHRISRHFLYE